MTKNARNRDLFFLFALIVVLVGLPWGIQAYDNHLWRTKATAGAKLFTLTAHSELGWLPGKVHGYDAITLYSKSRSARNLTLEVKKGDLVVLKITSSDVVHGFSLKDFGIFLKDGIRPGKVALVSFKADKAGTFTFTCSIICGDEHKKMQGTLVVRA
jgi:heme/copper-type cytochrome/quinol oxidase subunit 2